MTIDTQKTQENKVSIAELNTLIDNHLMEGDVNALVNLRSDILLKYLPVIQLIERIEAEVKKLKPSKGQYGVNNPLTVSETKTQIVDEEAVYNILKKQGYKPLDYFKIKLSEAPVKAILQLHPKLTTPGEPTQRFSYSKK